MIKTLSFDYVLHVYSEMPNSGDLKSGDSLFFTTPLEFQQKPSPPPLRQIDPALNGNDLSNYIKSYMRYILSKFTVIVLMPEMIFQ